jgi:hypothetical protein
MFASPEPTRALLQAPAPSSGSLDVTILAPLSTPGPVPTATHSVTDAHETAWRSIVALSVVFLHALLLPVGSVDTKIALV